MSDKQKRMFAVLLSLLLLCCGGLWLVNYLNNRPVQNEEEEAVLLAGELGAIVRMDTVSARGELTFLLQDGIWQVAGQEDYPLNTATVQNLADMLQALTPLKTLDNTRLDSMEAYGLQEPTQHVTVTDEAGQSLCFTLGINIGGNNYLQRQGDENIYMVSGTLETYLSYSLEDMLLMDSFPALTDSLIRSVTVTGAAEVTFYPILTESSDSSGYVSTTTQWLVGEVDVTEHETVAAAVKEVKRIELVENLDYSGSEESLQQYGLDSPAMTLQLEYLNSSGEELSLTLTVSAALADGSYAARLGDSRQINRMEAGTLDALLQLAEEGLS